MKGNGTTKDQGRMLVSVYNRSMEANENGYRRLTRVSFSSRSNRSGLAPIADVQVFTDVPGSLKDYKVFNNSLWPEQHVQVGIEKARSRYFNRVPVGFMSTGGVPKIYLGTNLIRWAGKPLTAVPFGTANSRPVGSTHDLRERDLTRHYSFNPGKYPVHAYQLRAVGKMYTPQVEQHPHFVTGGAATVTLPDFLACIRKGMGKFRLREDGPDAAEIALRKISPEAKRDSNGTAGADGLLHLYKCSIDSRWPTLCGADVSGIYKVNEVGTLVSHTEIEKEDLKGVNPDLAFQLDGRWYWKTLNEVPNPEGLLSQQLKDLFIGAPYAVSLEPIVGTHFTYKTLGTSLWRPKGLRSNMLPRDLVCSSDYQAWKMIAVLSTLRISGENMYVSFDLAYNGFMPWVDWGTVGFSPVQSILNPRNELTCHTSGIEMDLLNFDVVCDLREKRHHKQAAMLSRPYTPAKPNIEVSDPALSEPEEAEPETIADTLPEPVESEPAAPAGTELAHEQCPPDEFMAEPAS
jgi:hypothetical protein